MKYASDFRKIARESLRGRWGIAVLAGLLAGLLGVATGGGTDFSLNFDLDNGTSLEYGDQPIYNFGQGWNEELTNILIGGAVVIVIVGIVMAIIFYILGSVVGTGYAKFNLDLVDRQKEPEIGTMFGYFKHWQPIVVANLLKDLYVFLWMLLLIIPGIIASYSYAMTGYILAENPELSASEAVARSKEMMTGNRWRLFCLQISFIGWSLLCGLTLGIGNLWLTPYRQAATAAFYREISGTETIIETVDQAGPEFL